ncbi:hypothetical protein Pyrde_0080 [Pyrodictium delaneyi]|uniref:Transcriptional regulator n=1 Tax=Pyrodictium delaneyi TaxID=1273541 RepID=A0A0P0N1J3_9CREN|nr:hypothetical protein [Pyrodictium delaneyi]ALL00130.1 hypothetical protein Pyrde_0080 [Pyrodictium delaneyi]OWJ54222.1 hypothetical protein Pdsh_06950 [Pyrodictium delaneyi]
MRFVDKIGVLLELAERSDGCIEQRELAHELEKRGLNPVTAKSSASRLVNKLLSAGLAVECSPSPRGSKRIYVEPDILRTLIQVCKLCKEV